MPAIDPRNPDASLVAVFSNHAVKNEGKSALAGRPIFDDMEIVTIRIPGSRTGTSVQPATAVARWVSDPESGEQRQETYAERFRHQYQQFKARQTQTLQGTPLDYATFLTEGRRAELRALNIYTVEQLAGVDGQELKNLGPGGRDMKNRAVEFIEDAKTNAPSARAVAENEALKARLALVEEDNENLKQRVASSANGEGSFADMSDEQVVAYITTHAGHAPTGNPNRKTLVRMAMDARPNPKAA